MEFLLALVPSIGVLFLFWLAIRALVQADRRERAAQARFEAQNADGTGPGRDPDLTVRPETAVTVDIDAATLREGD